MQKIAAFVALLVFSVGPALAEQSREDAYVACVIGNAAVNLHNRMDAEAAEIAAGEFCAPLFKVIDEQEAEGVSDFIHSAISDLSESSLFSLDLTPLELGMGN